MRQELRACIFYTTDHFNVNDIELSYLDRSAGKHAHFEFCLVTWLVENTSSALWLVKEHSTNLRAKQEFWKRKDKTDKFWSQLKKTSMTLINARESMLKPLIQRSLRRVRAHESAWYVHQIHDVTFRRKPGLTVFGFFTKHHLVPGPVILSSNQRAAYCNAIS